MVFGITIEVTDTVSNVFSNLSNTLQNMFISNSCEFPYQLTFYDLIHS